MQQQTLGDYIHHTKYSETFKLLDKIYNEPFDNDVDNSTWDADGADNKKKPDDSTHEAAYKYLMDQDVLDEGVVLKTHEILMKDATSKNEGKWSVQDFWHTKLNQSIKNLIKSYSPEGGLQMVHDFFKKF